MSIRIHIPLRNTQIRCRQGEILIQALRQGGLSLEAACGGQGTCGRCAVKVLQGRCSAPPAAFLTAMRREEGYVLACQAVVEEDLVIEVPETAAIYRGDETVISDGSADFSLPLDGRPLSRKIALQAPEPVPGSQLADFERLTSGLKEFEPLEGTLDTLQNLPRMLRSRHGEVTATLYEKGYNHQIIRLEPGNTADRHFGVACDIGTTTVALQLVDLHTGRVVDTVSAYNDQVHCGADVISRILYAKRKGHLEELTRRIVDTINGLLGAVFSLQQIKTEEVTAAVLAGNTTMIHLLLGIDPRHIREEPYLPAVKTLPLLCAKDMGIHLHPAAPILLSPSVGSYVGGDITSGLLYALMRQTSPGIDLFIDIGTNGELVLSGEQWRIGCACSAGPAFEGVGIQCGMRAAEGAIDRVTWDADQGQTVCRVIGNGLPRGICGSGLIELVATLFQQGILGRDGRFQHNRESDRIHHHGRQSRYLLVPAAEAAGGQEIYLSEQDIANIVRAKAAIFSAVALLLRKVGLRFQDIQNIWVAGGFGRQLNIRQAMTIGLFPEMDLQRFTYLGNTSLQGARLALLSATHRRKLMEIAKEITYVDLSSEPGYMLEYTAALFLPHTDQTLFSQSAKNLQSATKVGD